MTIKKVSDTKTDSGDAQSTTAQKTVAEQIWSEIKGKAIQMFALPPQSVDQFCSFVMLDPTRCFLTYKISAVLPALEEALRADYTCELMERYIVVARKLKY